VQIGFDSRDGHNYDSIGFADLPATAVTGLGKIWASPGTVAKGIYIT